MRAVEKYYSVQECAWALSVSTKTVLRCISARELEGVVNLGSEERPDYRIPTSSINNYLEARRVFSEPGVAARSVGELRRKSKGV